MNQEYNREYLEELAHKYKEGTLTEEETAYFETWYNGFDDGRLELPADYAANPIVVRDRMHRQLQERVSASHKKTGRIFRIPPAWQWSVAAAVILVAIGLLLRIYVFETQDKPAPVSAGIKLPIPPGSDKAVLTLANGVILRLNGQLQGTIARQGQIDIQKKAGGQIIYSVARNGGDGTALVMNKITTPNGGQFRITLQDGTQVWLNAGSSLEYPVAFSKRGQRMVELDGEAYFEVAKDKARPFIVASKGQRVEVLGTHFNINSYADEATIRTTLEEGSVRVTAGGTGRVIVPGEQAMLNSNGNIVVTKADLETELAWKNGKIRFKDADLRTIMREVARWYDVEVAYEGKMPKRLFNGGISRQSDLSTLLHILEENNIHFRVEGLSSGRKKITVIP